MIVTTWSHADEVLGAHAELDIRAGGVPRPHLIVFEGVVATLAALGPDGRCPPCSRTLLELTELVAAVGAERFALGIDLRDDGGVGSPTAASVPLTVAAVTAPRVHVRIRTWPGRRRRRTRLHAVSYGRADDGAPVWGRPRTVRLWRRAALRRRLTGVIGDERVPAQPAEVVAAYLLRAGYTIGTADGWAARYGLDALSGR